MVRSQERIAEKQRQTAGEASPIDSARDRSGTASIHSIHAFGRGRLSRDEYSAPSAAL
jgi:hypothetical protein